MKKDTKKVYLKNFGCQMNMRDSEIILGMLLGQGYKQAKQLEEANIILFNTCSVRQHAEERVWGNVGMLRKIKERNQKPEHRNQKKIIGIIGCMVQSYQEEIFRRLPHVDFICGPEEIDKIPKLIKQATQKTHLMAVDILRDRPERIYHIPYRQDKKQAYVNISEGCNNFCSYCIVPFVRGQQKCRNWQDILREVKMLAKKGIKEITLLGQNVNSYRSPRIEKEKPSVDFVKLLELVHNVSGIKKICFVTSHPKDTNTRLFVAMAKLPKVEKYLHLPLQSGSNRVLRIMNRKYTANEYWHLVKNYRKIVPEGKLSTDIIVGFPTENKSDFQDTLRMMQRIKFDWAYIFKYSSRPHTKAAKLKDDVPKEEKERRHRLVLEYQKNLVQVKNAR